MVNRGDTIIVNKNKGEVIDIIKRYDGRYKIVYQTKDKTKSFIEGDYDFKIGDKDE